MKDYVVTVLESRPLTGSVHLLTLDAGEPLFIHGGQFANLSVGDGAHLLRRPFAVCIAAGSAFTVCFQIKGEGTRLLAAKKKGDTLSALLPLGNGFPAVPKGQKIALVGGGAGIFPMISVLAEYGAANPIDCYVGFRGKADICLKEQLEKSDFLCVATDDGSYGYHGNAVQAFCAHGGERRPDVIFACGPTPMLRALKKAAEERDIPAYVSLEERMGCGIGACLVCVCDKADGNDSKQSGGKLRVCKDGPVFPIGEVIL